MPEGAMHHIFWSHRRTGGGDCSKTTGCNTCNLQWVKNTSRKLNESRYVGICKLVILNYSSSLPQHSLVSSCCACVYIEFVFYLSLPVLFCYCLCFASCLKFDFLFCHFPWLLSHVVHFLQLCSLTWLPCLCLNSSFFPLSFVMALISFAYVLLSVCTEEFAFRTASTTSIKLQYKARLSWY